MLGVAWEGSHARKGVIMSRKVTITYYLSEKGQKASLLAGGDGKKEQIITTSLDKDFYEDVVKLGLVDDNGDIALKIGDVWNEVVIDYKFGYTNTIYGKQPCIEKVKAKSLFDRPQSIAEIISFEKDRRKRIDYKYKELAPIVAEKLKEYKEMVKKIEEEEERKRQEKERLREAELEKARKARELFEKDKIEWIKKHGSEHLKVAIDLGYNCQRKYALERAEKEFPNYVLDYNSTADYYARSCPSEDALFEVKELIDKGYNAKVVWLINEPSNHIESDDSDIDYCSNDFVECEAILIKDYLGNYELFKLFS